MRGEGGIYAINVSIIFAPDCRCAWRRCYCQLMEEYVWKHSLYPGGCSWDSVWGSGIFGYLWSGEISEKYHFGGQVLNGQVYVIRN
jgi:hypothetical protein